MQNSKRWWEPGRPSGVLAILEVMENLEVMQIPRLCVGVLEWDFGEILRCYGTLRASGW